MKKNFYIFALFSLAVLVSSCHDDLGEQSNSNSIRYKAEWTVVDIPATKTRAMFLSEDGVDTLMATLTVEENTAQPTEPESMTRGVPVTGSNLDKFIVDAWVKQDNSHYIDNQAATKQATGYFTTSTAYTWFAGDPEMEFWAYSHRDKASGMSNITRHSGTPSTMTFDYTVPTGDAKVQDDIVFSNVNTRKTANCEVGFTFKHALAEVRFKVTDVPNGIVKSVTLEDVASKGSCSFNGSTFTWSGQSTTKNFSHTYNQNVTHGAAANVFDEENKGDVFMMVPQNVAGKKIKILFHFTDGDYDRELIYTLPAGSEWQAERVYTYNLSYEQGVSITVEDTYSGLVKNAPTVTNTGDYPVWVRAVLIGNWVDANGIIIGTPWNESVGTFNNKSAKWVFNNTDGYYYYTEKVPVHLPTDAAGNNVTEAMFQTYTAPSVPSGADHLELIIAAQAIYSTETTYTAAWENKN